jgi:hypothetical protein
MKQYRKYFIKAVKENFPASADKIISETDNSFHIISVDISFAKNSKNPIDKRLDFCGYFLALIMALDKQGENFETIRKVCLEVVIDYVRPKNKVQLLFKKLPVKIINTWVARQLLKVFAKKVSRNENKGGFIAHIITDKNETYGLGYGVDILECGICKLFSKYNYHKYAGVLCEVDEITSGLAGLKLIRTGTIANGAAKCDFRFKKKQPGK